MPRELRRVRPSLGGSGTFQAPIGGHFAHAVPGSAEYFIQDNYTAPWQDEHYPIHTRDIIDFKKPLGYQDTSLVEDSPPLETTRLRTRIR